MWQESVISGNQVVQTELKPGEVLLWSGQPRGGIRFRPYDIFLIPFSLMWGGFAIFWELMALAMFFGFSGMRSGPVTGFAIIFPLFGIPFVLVGLYLIFGRFIVDAKSRERTFYAVTDQRVIIITTLFGYKVQSFNLRQLPGLELTQSADGSGTITFGSTGSFGTWSGGSSSRRYQPPSFEMIEKVREVYQVIQNTQQQSGKSLP